MKRILSFAAVMLGLVALSSCMKENIEPSQEGSTNGTFTISVPQDVVTKAYGDGKFAAKNVIIGVFDENGVERYRKNYEWGTDKFTETITLPFVMGKSYQMVFWAQYGNAYGDPKEMELKEITMPYTKSNQENLDAFYWYEPVFTVTEDFTKNITMRRPFAQVNFATTPGDIDESIAAGLDVNIGDKAVVTVKNAAKTLNLFTGETSDYAAVSVPATEFPKDANGKYHEITVEGKTYEILAMNYFLVADKDAVDGKTTAEMSLKVGELELSVPQAQMKRNYRTNIVGELLTGEGTFNVTIDPIFGGDFNHNGITGDGSEDIKPEQPDTPDTPVTPEPDPEQPDQPEQPEQPAGPQVVTVAEFLAAADDDTIEYQVSGTISGIYQAYNSQYNNISIYISDTTGEMLAYRVSCEGITDPASTITVGDEITVKGKRVLYNNAPQMAQGGVIVAHKDVVVEEPELPADSDFTSNVEWTADSNTKSYSEKATINGVADVPVLKLGTSSVVGSATFTIPAGTSKISFYGVAWNGKTGKLTMSIPSNEAKEFTFKSNTGAANQSPYTMTVTTDDHYVVELAAPCTEETTVSLSTVENATRVILFGIQAE